MFSLAFLLVLCGTLYFAFLGRGDLAGHSEGNYAEIPREMLESGDWAVPHLNYVPYLEKPPLFYWLTAASYRWLGETAFAARLWSAIPSVLLVLAVFAFTRLRRDAEEALLAGCMLATSVGMIAMARISYMDMLLCFFTALAFLTFYQGMMADGGRAKAWFLCFFMALGLAMLTKGLIGVVLPAGGIFLHLLFYRKWASLKKIPWILGLLIFLALTLPWHLFAGVKNEKFFWFYFVNEHWLRFLGKRLPKDYYAGPFYYQFLRLLFLFLPWTLFLLPALRRFRKVLADEWQGYLICWLLSFLGFYTLSKAKANYYMMPAMPALAMLLAAQLRSSVWEFKSGLSWRIGLGVLAAGAAGLYAFLALYPYALLKKMAPGAYPFLLTAAGLLAFGLLIAFALATCRHWRASFYAMIATIALAMLPVFAKDQIFERRGSVQPLICMIQANAGKDTMIAMRGKYEDNSLLSFYLRRRMHIVSDQGDVGGDLDFGSRFAENKPYFLQWNDFLQRFGGQEKILYITLREADYGELLGNHPQKTRLIARSGYRLLIANYPPKTVNPAAGAKSASE